MQDDNRPLVSVLLPFRNAAATLADCIESILAQTLTDFEIIAVNDFSTDASSNILLRYRDERIRLVDNQQRGLVPALNTGLAHCSATLVARMDADDIMHTGRLEKQYRYMRRHPEVTLLATRARNS